MVNKFNSKWLIEQFKDNQSMLNTKNISSETILVLNQIAFMFHWINEFNVDITKQESYFKIRHNLIKQGLSKENDIQEKYPKLEKKDRCAFQERKYCNFGEGYNRCEYMKYNNSKDISDQNRWECIYKNKKTNQKATINQ